MISRNGTSEGRKVVKWNVEETYTWLRKQNAVYEDYIVSSCIKSASSLEILPLMNLGFPTRSETK